MANFNPVTNYFLASPVMLFAASVLFTFASFFWVRKLISGFRAALVPIVAFSFLNGFIAVVTEVLIDRPMPSAMMIFVPVATVLEIRCISRDRLWAYLFIFAAFLLNFSAVHDLTVAAVGLIPDSFPWPRTSQEYRIIIFTLALLLCTFMLTALTCLMPAAELSGILHSREKSLLLLLYLLASGTVLVIASGVTAPVLFSDTADREFLTPVYIDLVLKDFLLLSCSYMITLLQCRAEHFSAQSDELGSKLQKEKNFRSAIRQKAVLSYVVNVSQNRVEEGLDYFSERLRGNPPDDYRHILFGLTRTCVHPDDRKDILRQGTALLAAETIPKKSMMNIRFRISPQQFLEDVRLPDPSAILSRGDKEWLWLEARLTLVADDAGGDILAYIELLDIDRQVAYEDELINAAQIDSLTGIYNRAALEAHVCRYLSDKDASGAMFMIDLDNFKMVNDVYGHQEGDLLLQRMASLLQAEFRSEDILGRLGGDEFCVFATGMHDADALSERAERLVKAARLLNTTSTGQPFSISLSVGIAICPDYGRDYQTLYQNSDIALYQTKCTGKNTFHIYSGEQRDPYYNARQTE